MKSVFSYRHAGQWPGCSLHFFTREGRFSFSEADFLHLSVLSYIMLFELP